MERIRNLVGAEVGRVDGQFQRATLERMYANVAGEYPAIDDGVHDLRLGVAKAVGVMDDRLTDTPYLNKTQVEAIYEALSQRDVIYTGEVLYRECPVCGEGPVSVERVTAPDGLSVRDACLAKRSGDLTVYEHRHPNVPDRPRPAETPTD